MSNRLAQTSSPYLQQHQDNPVDWFPWGDEALAKAQAENKLLIVSIGYSTCHWCHVMAHESFEDDEVAELMNAQFVSIKVDREERPDIDAIYMDAVQAMTGRGGWPLNAVCLPDGRPVWGGTYFPKPNWMNALAQLHEKYAANPAQFEEQAERLTQHIQSMDLVPDASTHPFDAADVTRSFLQFRQRFDLTHGGFEGAPKFPMPTSWEFLLQYSHHSDQAAVEDALKITLEKMAWGGIYDHVGGGFARYSVDEVWHIPHYEKMLYDNGQLVSLYSKAYRKFKNPLYKRVVSETVTWLEREMLHESGAFFSAQDADSEGEEGKFYVWTADELVQALGKDAELYKQIYNMTPEGNWEHGKNTPIRREQTGILATELGITETKLLAKMGEMNAKLYAERAKRVWPGTDDKTLVSWNALMDSGLIEAYRSFGDDKYLELARQNLAFIEENMTDGDRLYRNYKDGQPAINAYLDDYALLITALLDIYQATFEPQYLTRAEAYIDYVEAHFIDPETGLYFYTSDQDAALIARKKELQDNVIPGSNSVMAHALLTYGLLMGSPAHTDKAQTMLRRMLQHVDKYPSSFANWARLRLRFVYPDHELVILGPDADTARTAALKQFLPNVLLAGSTTDSDLTPLFNGRFHADKTLFYLCQQGACQLPSESLAGALEGLQT